MTTHHSRLRVALVSSPRFPVREPFVGGLESHVWHLHRRLLEAGVDATLFAPQGSDGVTPESTFPVGTWRPGPIAATDPTIPSHGFIDETTALLQTMDAFMTSLAGRFDVVHVHAPHHTPIVMAPYLPMPMLVTLHTPPTAWMEAAISVTRGRGVTFAAVSGFIADAWAIIPDRPRVIHNGVDLEAWPVGPGGEALVWSGRLIPEKAPHVAIDAARRAGMPLRLAGPVSNEAYYEQVILPRLGGGIEHVGHLSRRELARLIGSSSACLVTPDWDEPFGLVVAESLACGTPVVAFERGGIPEVLGPPSNGALVTPGSIEEMALAIPRALQLDRAAIRRDARVRLGEERMAEQYLQLYKVLRRRNTLAMRPGLAGGSVHAQRGQLPSRVVDLGQATLSESLEPPMHGEPSPA